MNLAACNWHEPGGLAAAEAIAAFLVSVGMMVRVEPLTGPSFVAGLAIERGTIQIEPGGTAHPGDLLHEAGHIAVAEPSRRADLSEVGSDPGEEMAAIAWSVAAAQACGIGLDILFHPAGYNGEFDWLRGVFEQGQPFGVPLLAWYGLTSADDYPAMARWLR